MSADLAISVRNVSKLYRIWREPSSRLKAPLLAAAARMFPQKSRPQAALARAAAASCRDFYALRDISLPVRRGGSVGIIGRNGSGKSTLLQIIAGTLRPNAGSVDVHGRVAALLELGSGFNPDFTGTENVFLNGAVLGLPRKKMESRFDEIAAFADIGDFIEQPVKTYSSGMLMRLAFAVQTAVDPDILIIDEALSVGDIFFSQKCSRRMKELRDGGTTLLFVSHDLSSVRDLCEHALYLRQGRAEFYGDCQQAIAHYYAEGRESSAPAEADGAPASSAAAPLDAPPALENFLREALWVRDAAAPATGAAQILGVSLRDSAGRITTKVQLGKRLVFQILFRAVRAGRFQTAVELKNRHDHLINSTSCHTCGLAAAELAVGETCFFELTMTCNFEAGYYTCQVVLAEDDGRPNRGLRTDATPWLGPFLIDWDYENNRAPFLGMFGPPVEARYRKT